MNPKLFVIIPYYQQEQGVLARALHSVFAQKNAPAFEVLVIDDESPIPAEDELKQFDVTPFPVRIIRQTNGGPANARNRGLDELPEDTTYVAFLDSDDEWLEDHIARAIMALEQGYDFYFADLFHIGRDVSAFQRSGRVKPENFQEIIPGTLLHRYSGDMFDQTLRGNIIGTPTVVYRFEKMPTLRFRKEFVYAGEDYLFWMSITQLTDKFAFSSKVECKCGKGVNVFSGSGWGTEKSMIRVHQEMKYRKAVNKLFKLNEIQKTENNRVIKGYRHTFVRDVLNRLSHKRSLDFHAVKQQFKLDPQTYLFFLPITLNILLESVFSKKQS